MKLQSDLGPTVSTNTDNTPATKQSKLSKRQRIEEKRKQRIAKLKVVKNQASQQLTAAQSSTKSMGKFDPKAHKEERQHRMKRRKQYCTFTGIQEEIDRNLSILDSVKRAGSKKLRHSV